MLDDGARKVAIIDIDYHHGNGTQSIFYQRDDVLFVSIHADPRNEYPFYLGHADERGEGAGHGYNLNLPLAAGSSVQAWFAALETACVRIGSCAGRAGGVAGRGYVRGRPAVALRAAKRGLPENRRTPGVAGQADRLHLRRRLCGERTRVNVVNVLEGYETAL
jgi:hypothetical protein